MVEWTEYREVALDFLLELKALKKCGHHEEFEDGDFELKDLWGRATKEHNKGNLGSAYWASSMTSNDFKHILQRAYDDNAGDCGECEYDLNH